MTTFCWGTLAGAPEWRRSFYNRARAAFCWSNRSSKVSDDLYRHHHDTHSHHQADSMTTFCWGTPVGTPAILITDCAFLQPALNSKQPPSSSSWYAFSSSSKVNDDLLLILLRHPSWGNRHPHHHDTHSHHQVESMTNFCWGTPVGAPKWTRSFYNEARAAFCWGNRSSKVSDGLHEKG